MRVDPHEATCLVSPSLSEDNVWNPSFLGKLGRSKKMHCVKFVKNQHDLDQIESLELAQENLHLELHPTPQLKAHPPLQMLRILEMHLEGHGEQGMTWVHRRGYNAQPRSFYPSRHRKPKTQGWVNRETKGYVTPNFVSSLYHIVLHFD